MTLSCIVDQLHLTPLVAPAADPEISGCYVGDLLSWVMGRAPEGSLWITVMGNANAIAVAKLADLSAILLCEGSPLDREAAERAEEQGVPVFQSPLPAYELAVEAARLLGKP